MFKRTAGKYNSLYKLEEFYDWYCATVSDPLPKSIFKEIFRIYIQRIMVEIIYNSFDFNMGHRLGSLRIRDKDYITTLDKNGNVDKGKLIPDWGRTLKKWKKLYSDIDPSEWKALENKPIIFFDNDHSDQTVKQWFWDKTSSNLLHQGMYKFNATRYWDRLLAKVNLESNISYYK